MSAHVPEEMRTHHSSFEIERYSIAKASFGLNATISRPPVWRGQDGQNETEQPDHSANLGDSITASTRVRFSVHTPPRKRRMRQRHVTGLDLNKGMLAVARIVSNDGAPIDWIEGSALDLPFEAGTFDLVLCQLGLQFFPDQERALREMRRVLSGTGRAALSVYSPIERTPGANAFVLALDRVLGPTASRIKRGEHSLNAPDELRDLLTAAGFAKVEVHRWFNKSHFPLSSTM
jgi:SAM-dependent methyltransferase